MRKRTCRRCGWETTLGLCPMCGLGTVIAAMVPIVVLALVILLVFSWGTAWAWPECTPHHQECLDRDCHRDLRDAGAEAWETRALCDVVASGNIGKSWTDYVRVSDEELAMGIAHFTAGAGRLGLSAPSPYCSDLGHYWEALSFLYSDESVPVMLSAWRRLVGPAVRAATRKGWTGRRVVLVASAASSQPGRVRRLVERCEDPCCLATSYVITGGRVSGHRVRRVETAGFGHCVEGG